MNADSEKRAGGFQEAFFGIVKGGEEVEAGEAFYFVDGGEEFREGLGDLVLVGEDWWWGRSS
ncbi:MAG: hypothetical protein FJW20_01955 [Acidimicrobiia bacterium]|nr:hypothetical protein [Acidimicrobiia bacterium]